MVFETILRLKGNMVVPGTWIFPDDAQVHAATERGLIVNQHHAIPLGVNVARWPQDVPYNFSTHPEILERAWTNAVATYKPDEEILWSVGLRGLSDSSYASLDPSVRNNDPLLGQRISEAIAEQMKIVRAKYPNAQFVTDLWQEGARLTQEGYLKIPPEVSLVWADTGYGDMQDGGKVGRRPGHVLPRGHDERPGESALGDGAGLDHPVRDRPLHQGRRDFVLPGEHQRHSARGDDHARGDGDGLGRIAGVPATTGGAADPEGDADAAFYKKWATEEFGAKSADALAKVYKEYFAAPAPRPSFGPPRMTSAGNAPPPPPRYSNVPLVVGDQHYHSEARRILLDYLSGHQVVGIPSQSPKWTQPRVGFHA